MEIIVIIITTGLFGLVYRKINPFIRGLFTLGFLVSTFVLYYLLAFFSL